MGRKKKFYTPTQYDELDTSREVDTLMGQDLLGSILSGNAIAGIEPPKNNESDLDFSHNLEGFCKHYFPDIFKSDFCAFHKDVFVTVQDRVLNHAKEKSYVARAAPRGHGKSQIISFGVPLWCICYGYRKNILIVSDTGAQAEQYIADIKGQLEDNELLLADFGNLVEKKQMWRVNEIVTDNKVHLICKSAGQSLRGIKYNSVRPDMVIIDDLENDENVETPEQRRKLYNWFTKVLMKCGNINTFFIYIGTILNYDSLLYKVLHDVSFAVWNRKLYKAVYQFSQSPHWAKWEIILSDLTLGNDAASKAYEYYKKHKSTMLKGVKCLWPDKEKDYYYNLMLERFNDEEAFNSELQNDPLTDTMRTFKVEWLNQDIYKPENLPEITDVWYAVDMSMGKKRSDTSAIIGIGKGVDNYLYVLEADIKRKRSVEQSIDDLVYHIVKYYDKLRGFAVETDLFLEFVSDVMKERILDKGLYVNWVEIKQAHVGSKANRIRTLVPPIQHGYLRFNESHRTLLSQLKNYPKDNDDGVDALQMAMSIIKTSQMDSFCFTKLSEGSDIGFQQNGLENRLYLPRRLR